MATLQSIFCRGVRNPHLLTNPLLLVTQPFLDFLNPPPPSPRNFTASQSFSNYINILRLV